MPTQTRLSVVNDMLACLGETPVNALEEGHPMVPTALRMLDTAASRLQAGPWWFNKELTDLLPDTEGYIYIPNDALSVDPIDTSHRYTQRGRRLFKPMDADAENKFKFTSKVRVWLNRDIPFEDLPFVVQDVISYQAQLEFMKAYEADAQKFQQVSTSFKLAWIALNSEHIRNVDANMLHRRYIYNDRTEIGSTGMEADYWPHP